MQGVPFSLTPIPFGFTRCDLRIQSSLNRQGVRDRGRIEKKSEEWIQQPPNEPQDRAGRVVERLLLEDWRRRWNDLRCRGQLAGAPAQLIEEPRFQIARVENRIEPPRGEFLDLLVGQIDAAPLRDARPDVAHDLLDIDAISALPSGLFGWRLSPFIPAPLIPAPPAVEVTTAPLRIVIHCHEVSTF
jgi:hypothetical protein